MAHPGGPAARAPHWRGAVVGSLVFAVLIGARVLSAQGEGVGHARAVESAAPAGPAIAAGDVVVNEIDYDLPGTDDAEFVELFNASGGSVSLGELDLVGTNGSTNPGSEYLRLELPDATLPDGGYFVIGAASVPDVDLVVADPGFLQNGAPDSIAVVQSIPSAPENDVLIDSVSYEGDTAGGPSSGGSWTEGSGIGLDDSTTIAHLGLSRFPTGADSGVNNVDLSRRCITPGQPNVEGSSSCPPPASGETPTPTEVVPSATSTDEPPTATATEQSPATETATDAPPTATATIESPDTPTATSPPPATETPTIEPPATATATIEPPFTETATAPAEGSATPTPIGGPPFATNTALPDATVTASATPAPLAVQLVSFEVARTWNRAVLRWSTASEIDHAGFLVYRRSAAGLERVSARLIPPRGSELHGARYRYVDRDAPPRASYWLADVDSAGRLTWHGPVRPRASKHPSVDAHQGGER